VARVERKLTTIPAADAVGYSAAMAVDEEAALVALRRARDVFTRLIERHRGRVFGNSGDGLLAEFPSVVEAVQCAIEVQRELAGRHAAPGATSFRIGLHLGDVMVDGDNLFGDGVNLAARLESMAEPGGVLLSQPVYDQVRNKLSVGFDYLGAKRPKNLAADVAVYRVALNGSRRHRDRAPDVEASRPPAPTTEPAKADGWRRTVNLARMLGIVWLGLLAVDLLTGAGFWAHWPAIAILTGLGLRAAPHFTRGWFGKLEVRLAVLVAGLTLINLTTWAGTLWVIWPALALVVIEAIRRTAFKRQGSTPPR
jgi:adenylate cyclase